ncbi:hypothetical protein B0H11DRAFT_1932120 [Mycena galericulata]|nr:hypothetical protein B0H11DRAFT_1932119 [Mycena galericulata]KAJ7442922.1 hypothetical protein B0H11DRAFT_1932120 [Mycena galericulata]
MATLQFGTDYWKEHLPGCQSLSSEAKLHLILSLVIYLGVSIRALLVFIFESDIQPLKDRASRFLGYTPSNSDPHIRFPPAHIFSLWVNRCTSSGQWDQIQEMITPVAQGIVLSESNC